MMALAKSIVKQITQRVVRFGDSLDTFNVPILVFASFARQKEKARSSWRLRSCCLSIDVGSSTVSDEMFAPGLATRSPR